MDETVILFSRKHRRGEGASDKNIAAHLRDGLDAKVFETTFKTPLGFKRRVSQLDKHAREYLGGLVLVVHYNDPVIFNGLIQGIIPNRFFLFYDEKAKTGGLAYTNTKGRGSKSLHKLYQFKMFNATELFLGNSACDGYYKTIYMRNKYQSEVTPSCPIGESWRLLTVDDNLTSGAYICKAVIGYNDFRHYRVHARIAEQAYTVETVEVSTFDKALNYALRFRAHPFVIRQAWPILGTNFIIIADDARDNWPSGDVTIIYFGRKNIKPFTRERHNLSKILNEILTKNI